MDIRAVIWNDCTERKLVGKVVHFLVARPGRKFGGRPGREFRWCHGGCTRYRYSKPWNGRMRGWITAY